MEEWTRRRFLVAVSSAMALAAFPGCTDGGNNASGPAGTAGPDVNGLDGTAAALTPWDRLRLLQDAVKASPDHLAPRVATLVAAKDVDGIVRFVREEVGVVAVHESGKDAVTGTLWGGEASLRAGRGTPRDRMTLLAALLTRVGVEATVKRAALPDGATAVDAWTGRELAPDERLMAAAGTGIPTATIPSSPPGSTPPAGDVDAIADALLAVIPGEAASATIHGPGTAAIAPGATVPVVELKHDGRTRWAFALAGIDLVDIAPVGLTSASTQPVPDVHVSVRVARTDLPGVAGDPVATTEVVSGRWPLTDVVGKVVTLTWQPPGDGLDVLRFGAEQVSVRIPTLSLRGPADDPNAPDDKATVAGSTVDLSSGVLGSPDDDASGGDASRGDGTSVSGPLGTMRMLDDAARADARGRAAKTTVTVQPSAFPTVELLVGVVDGDGAALPGLASADLVVEDQGQRQLTSVVANTAVDEVRVLVAYDTSSSVNEHWNRVGGRAEFERAVADAVARASGRAPFTTQVVRVGASPVAEKWVAPDADALAAQLGTPGASDSNVWAVVGRHAPTAGVSAVVVVSDFVSSDLPNTVPDLRARLEASGLPVLCIPIGAGDATSVPLVDELVRVSNGRKLDATSPTLADDLAQVIGERAERVQAATYRLRYVLPASQRDRGDRTVRLGIEGATGVDAGTATYQPPAEGQERRAGISGVYLTIQIGTTRDVRCLAGPITDSLGVPHRPGTSADVVEARAAADGITTISFEPAATAVAPMLDDAIGALADTGRIQGDDLETLAASAKGLRWYPMWPALLDPRTEHDGDCQPLGIDVVVVQHRAVDDSMQQRVDLVPTFSRRAGRSGDAREAFARALRASVARNVMESLADGSAAARLAGAALSHVAADASVTALPGFGADDLIRWRPTLERYRAYHRLVPSSPDLAAFWIVDKATGSATAVLLDGSGGATSATGLTPNCVTGGAGAVIAIIGLYIARLSTECGPGAKMVNGYRCDGLASGGAAAGTAGLFVDIASVGLGGGKTSWDLLPLPLDVVGYLVGGWKGVLVSLLAAIVAIIATEIECLGD